MKFLIRRSLPMALIFIAVAATADNPKNRNTEVENVTVGGTFLTSRIDANSDGEPASWCTIRIKGGHQGSSMMQCINEDVFSGPTPECPGGLWLVNDSNGGTGRGARTLPSGSDQIYVALLERYLCADLDGSAAGHDSGIIIGGTGRYAGATGTYGWSYTAQILYFDLAAQPQQLFGALIGSGQWVINFPDD